MKTELKTFHGKQKIKDKYLNRMLAHIEADELIQGTSFRNGKGCFVGCTLNGYEHADFETELGIPKSIAKLSDRIFEGLSKEDSIEFSREYYTKIKVGADLSLVTPKILVWVLSDEKNGALRLVQDEKHIKQKQAIENVITLLKRKIAGEDISTKQWGVAAAYAVDADAYAAVYAVYDADGAYAAAVYAAAVNVVADAVANVVARETFFTNLKEKLFQLFEECE